MPRLIRQLIPFLLAGVALVALSFGIILLAYLFFFGAVVGFILFMVIWLRNLFTSKKNISTPSKNRQGRIIDSDEWKKM